LESSKSYGALHLGENGKFLSYKCCGALPLRCYEAMLATLEHSKSLKLLRGLKRLYCYGALHLGENGKFLFYKCCGALPLRCYEAMLATQDFDTKNHIQKHLSDNMCFRDTVISLGKCHPELVEGGRCVGLCAGGGIEEL